ncbi:invasion associated locus B family protein [Pseudooceanicola sp. 502str34]
MTRISGFLATAAMIAFAGAAAAQDTTPAETTDAPAADAAPAQGEANRTPLAPDLAMGVTAGQDPNVGQTYVKEEIGDWQLQCIKVEAGEDPCELYQLLRDEDGNSVAEFSLFRAANQGEAVAGATVVVPLETLLPAGMMLGVDGTQGKRYPFLFCNQVGCFARIGLTQADVDAFKGGKEATLTIVPFAAPDVKVALKVSLIGFTAGYEKATVQER